MLVKEIMTNMRQAISLRSRQQEKLSSILLSSNAVSSFLSRETWSQTTSMIQQALHDHVIEDSGPGLLTRSIDSFLRNHNEETW